MSNVKHGKHAKQKFQVFEIYTVLLFVAFIFMSIGYAQISDIDMIISGQAKATAQNGVFIYDVGEASVGGSSGNAAESRVDTYFSTNLGTTVVLGNTTDSTISYNVSLYNNSTDKYVFVGVEEPVVYNNANKVKNEYITYSLSENMKAGETIIGHGADDKTLDFTVTFKYKDGVVPSADADKVLNSLLNIRFKLLPMVTLNAGNDSQVVDSSVYAIYPGVTPYEYQFTVENAASSSYNKVPMKYTLSAELAEGITENPLVVELYDLEGNLLSFDNAEEGIEIAGDGATSPLHNYKVRVKWNEDSKYNSADYAGKNFKYKVNFVGTPTVETAKYLGYTYNKSFVVNITTAPLNFSVNRTDANIFMENNNTSAGLEMGITNSSNVNYDTKYKVSITDDIKFTTSIAGSSVDLSDDGIERTLKGGADKNDNFTIDFTANVNNISRKENFDLKLSLMSPYTKEIVIPVNIRSVVLSADTSSATKDDVNVIISFDDSWKDRGSFEYSIGENNWQTISSSELNNGAVTKAVGVNGKVYARYNDGINGCGTAEILIDNIDKEAPNAFNIGTEVTTYSVKVSGTATDKISDGANEEIAGISGYEFAINNSSDLSSANWVTASVEPKNEYIFEKVANTKIVQGTKYYVSMRAIDHAGNITYASNAQSGNGFEVTTNTVPDSSSTSNIGITYSESGYEEYTNNDVIVYFENKTGNNDLVLKYQINATNDNGWLQYTAAGVSVSTNCVVYARLFDAAGQYTSNATATVGNIDKVAPVISAITNSSGGKWAKSITLSWGITENESGIEEVQFSSNGTDFSGKLDDSEWYGLTRTNQRNDTLYLRVKDKAGNYSNVVLTQMKIDGAVPSTSTISSSNVEETTFTLIANGADAYSGVASYEFYINGIKEYTITTADGTATWNVTGKDDDTPYVCKVIVYDAAGNSTPSNEITVITEPSVKPLDIELVSLGALDVELVLNNRTLDEIENIKYYFYGYNNDALLCHDLSGSDLDLTVSLFAHYPAYAKGYYELKAVVTDVYGMVEEASCRGYHSCFVAGTKVYTEDGFRNIEDIKKGEMVWSYSRNSNQYELKEVVNTIVGSSDVFVEISVGNDIIKCTPLHRFYVEDKGWIAAKNLSIGDMVTPKDFRSKNIITNIKYVEDKENPINVYNITVKENHNYLVGKYQLLVHNAKEPS